MQDSARSHTNGEREEATRISALAYYRKSNVDGGESIEQQRSWARGACAREEVEIKKEFADQAKKG